MASSQPQKPGCSQGRDISTQQHPPRGKERCGHWLGPPPRPRGAQRKGLELSGLGRRGQGEGWHIQSSPEGGGCPGSMARGCSGTEHLGVYPQPCPPRRPGACLPWSQPGTLIMLCLPMEPQVTAGRVPAGERGLGGKQSVGSLCDVPGWAHPLSHAAHRAPFLCGDKRVSGCCHVGWLQTCPGRRVLWRGQHRGCVSPRHAPGLAGGGPGWGGETQG